MARGCAAREWWGTGPSYDTAWRASQRAGARAFRHWQTDGMPESECVAAAIAAGVMAFMATPIISRTQP